MDKQFVFDESCEFDGITKEEFIEDVKNWDKECHNIKIGDHICRIHPTWFITCKKTTGDSYIDVLNALIKEFSEGKSIDYALDKLFKLYNEEYDEAEISGLIDYAMTTIIADYQNVKDGKSKKVGTFREMLERDLRNEY